MAGRFVGLTYTGDDTDETVTGKAPGETILGFGGSDTLRGGAGDDQIGGYSTSYTYFETEAVDRLYGDAGDDILVNAAIAPKGALIDGGAGVDTARIVSSFSASPKKIVFALDPKGSYLTVDGKQTLFVTAAEKFDFYGSGVVTLTGGALDDRASVFGENAVLKGLGGDDVLTTTLGGLLDGGAGDDYLGANATLDKTVTAIGGAGLSDLFSLGNGAGLALAMSGDAQRGMVVKSGSKVLANISGVEELSIAGGGGNDTLLGAVGDDSIRDGGGANTIRTGTGDDRIDVTLDRPADFIDAGGGTEDYARLTAFNATDAVAMTGKLGNFAVKVGTGVVATVRNVEQVSITTGSGNDKLFGGALDDDFFIGVGADEVAAGGGNDDASATLDKLLDRLDGGAGEFDRLSLMSGPQDQAVVMTKTGTGFDLRLGGTLAVRAWNWEGLDLSGSAKADTLVGLSGFDRLTGNEGDDKILGFGSNDSLTGGAGKDTLNGGDGNDTLYAGNGKPKFIFDPTDPLGGGSTKPGPLVTDTLLGGDGLDTADFSDLSLPGNITGTAIKGVTATLTAGKTVNATVGKTVVATLSSIENLTGSDYDDTLIGDRADNELSGLQGANLLNGGLGNDTADYGWMGSGDGAVVITLRDRGDVTVTAVATVPDQRVVNFKDTLRSIESLTGSQSADRLTGNGLANTLNGGFGDDVLNGLAGNDTLDGDFGTDTLNGGAGNDSLSGELMTGGAGLDTFRFDFTPREDTDSGQPVYTVADFNLRDDTASLSSFDFDLDATAPNGHLAAALFVNLAARGARVTADTRLIYDSRSGDLSFDADGARTEFAAIKFAHFDKQVALTAADFIVV